MSTPIDAAAALALTADLYRQWTECQQELAQERAEHAALREQYERLAATVRASAGVPDEDPAPPPP